MPVFQERPLCVFAGDSVSFVGLDGKLTLAADVRQVSGNGADLGAAAGDFHHDLWIRLRDESRYEVVLGIYRPRELLDETKVAPGSEASR
jgi:hypothetical protein